MKTIFMAFYINTINYIFKSIFWGGEEWSGGRMDWEFGIRDANYYIYNG